MKIKVSINSAKAEQVMNIPDSYLRGMSEDEKEDFIQSKYVMDFILSKVKCKVEEIEN